MLAGLVAVQGDWQRNKEYKYEVKIKGLKYSDQSSRDETSGLYARHQLTLRPYSDDVIIGRITKAEFMKSKPQQRDRYDQDDSQEYTVKDYSDAEFRNTPLSKPFKVNLRNGVIQSLGVDRSMSTFEVNQLRLIMNQFQVDTTGQNVNTRRSENYLPQRGSNTAFYTTMETRGNCETMYDISPIADYIVKSRPEWIPMPEMNDRNEEFMQIVKTKDSANCNRRRDVLATATKYLNENGVRESDLSIVEKQRIIVSGSLSRFTIQSAVSGYELLHNRYRNTPLVAVYVNATLKSMESADRQSTNLRDDLKIVENLEYDFNPKMDENGVVQPRLCE